MKPILIPIPVLLAAALAGAAAAQPKTDEHAGHHPAPAASAASAAAPASAATTEGEVRKFDRRAKKLTIEHGEIRNLDLPPMTMVFQVEDPSVLGKLKVGDGIRFVAEKSAAGIFAADIDSLP